jgi:hypothetical protein
MRDKPKHMFFLALVLMWLGMLSLVTPEVDKNFP